MRPTKASETPRSFTIQGICSTSAMAMRVTRAIEMERAKMHSVNVSLAFRRSLWRSASLSSSVSRRASYMPWWVRTWKKTYIPYAMMRKTEAIRDIDRVLAASSSADIRTVSVWRAT